MPGVPWEDSDSSKPFRFIVGPNKRDFTIHSALVARQSPAVNTLVNGNFNEARDGHVVLGWVDEQTFARFTQYAYTKAYANISPVARTLESEVSRTAKLWAKFKISANRFNHASFLGTSTPVAQDMTGVFLGHAKLHVFADYYGIAHLTELTLNKLGQALIPFNPKDGGVRDIVALLRYCFGTPAPEVLKSFVVLYAACKAEILWKNEAFQELVAGNRELSLAFIGQVMETVG